jgi:hypothetical protein
MNIAREELRRGVREVCARFPEEFVEAASLMVERAAFRFDRREPCGAEHALGLPRSF